MRQLLIVPLMLAMTISACAAPAPARPATPTAAPAPAKPSAAASPSPAVAASPSPVALASPSPSPVARPSPGLVPSPSPLAAASPSPAVAGRIRVITPKDGDKITSTDIPVEVEVSNFKLAPEDVGRPDKPGEGHIHVMHDGMSMAVLFNFYTTTRFTLPGQALEPGQHALTFDLATNTHQDLEETAQTIKIDYEPTNPKPAPAPETTTGKPQVTVTSPADGATVGPKFQIQVKPTNFQPSADLEGKQNIAGYGHYHVFVDINMQAMSQPGGMMSMAGMIGMPGSNTFDVDLNAWGNGKHTLTIEPVQDDHTPIEGATAASLTVNVQGATGP